MSAVAQHQPFIRSVRSLGELDALREISWHGTHARELGSGAQALLDAALRVRGVLQIALEPVSELPVLPQIDWRTYSLARQRNGKQSPKGSAIAEIAAQGHLWGNLRVAFELRQHSLESPLRFARFVGQQLGGLLNRFQLLQRHDALIFANEVLRRRIEMRKLAQRAKGLIAQSCGISDAEAMVRLLKLARKLRRSISQISEAVLLSQGDVWTQSPSMRRLAHGEFTNTRFNLSPGKTSINETAL